MVQAAKNVLFLCTGNSARSILAEACLNHAAQGRFRGYSAGSHPAGTVNPLALELLEARGISTAGLRSKGWDEFAPAGAPAMHFVVTVCDGAAGETCPVWPGAPLAAHWGVPDPAAVRGAIEARRNAFESAWTLLSRRIGRFLELPFGTLGAEALRERVRAIGDE